MFDFKLQYVDHPLHVVRLKDLVRDGLGPDPVELVRVDLVIVSLDYHLSPIKL